MLVDIVISVLAECKASSIYNTVEKEQKLASRIIGEFLSQNGEICPKVKGSEDEYQFSQQFISKTIGTPSTSMSRTNSNQSLTPSMGERY